MAYSAALKTGIGALRRQLERWNLGRQSAQFAQHGHHEPAPDAPLLLVACSGGRDSLALAAVAHIVCAAWGLRCGAVLVDHQLQEGSHEVSRHAAEQCRELGLDPVVVVPVTVAASGQGEEADARASRYGAFVETAQQYDASAILLAHTANDQAESVLIDLIRAAGTDALAGMPDHTSVDGVLFLRPWLMDVTREQTTAMCQDLGLHWWDDPTNGDHIAPQEPLPAAYPLRSRVRHTLMPEFNRFAGRDMVSRLVAATRIARRDVEYLNAQAASLYDEAVHMALPTPAAPGDDGTRDDECVETLAELDVDALREAPEALRFRVLDQALANCDIPHGSAQIEAIDQLICAWHGQRPVRVAKHYSALRWSHVIRLCKDKGHANRRRAGHHRP